MHTLEASVRSVLALTRNSQTETPLDQETKVLHKGIRMQLLIPPLLFLAGFFNEKFRLMDWR
mgnify:CR=1 FL=1